MKIQLKEKTKPRQEKIAKQLKHAEALFFS